MGTKTKPKGRRSRVSLRQFARSLGLASHGAVSKAIVTGRLRESIGHDARGRPFIADLALAKREWRAGAAKPRGGGKELMSAQAAVAQERVRALRLANALKTGEMVSARKVRRVAFETARTVRDNVMNVPDRVAAELAAESDPARVHARLGDELEKALDEVATILQGGG